MSPEKKKWDEKHESILEHFGMSDSHGQPELEVEKDQEEENAWKSQARDKEGKLSRIVLDGYANSVSEYWGFKAYAKEKDYKEL